MTNPATRPQVGKLIALLGTLDVRDRDDRLRVLSALVYRPLTSTNDLSRDEARIVIDLLATIRDDDAPAERLARITEPGARYLAALTLPEGVSV